VAEPWPPEIMTTIAPIIQWVLLILGWYALHKTAAIRARRQEDLARIEDIVKRIEAIRDKSIEHYTVSSDACARLAAQARLKNDLQSMASRIKLLRTHKPDCYDLDSQLIAFRMAVTGGTFESTEASPAPSDGPLVQELWYSADSFIVALHQEFEKAN